MSRLFASDDQNTAASTLASVLPTSLRGWFPLRLMGLISLLSREIPGVFSISTVWRHQFFGVLPSLWFSCHTHVTTGKTVALTMRTLVGRVTSEVERHYSVAVLPLILSCDPGRSSPTWFLHLRVEVGICICSQLFSISIGIMWKTLSRRKTFITKVLFFIAKENLSQEKHVFIMLKSCVIWASCHAKWDIHNYSLFSCNYLF